MLDDICWRYIGKTKTIQLTKSEVIVLKTILNNKNQVTSYAMLEEKLYGKSIEKRERIIIIINRLRKKLKGELEIKTKNQIGYYI